MRSGYSSKQTKIKKIGMIALIIILIVLIILFAMKVFNIDMDITSEKPSSSTSDKYTGGDFDLPPNDDTTIMNPSNMIPNEIPQIISPSKK